MTPEQLKASIIQAALEGKLTQQMKEDTPVSVTLNEIQKLRNAMIKNKEIKKVDVLPIDDTVPFDIPDSWQWIRIGSIEEINLGFTYRPEYTEEGVYFLSVKDISGGKIDFQNAKKVSQETYDNAAYGSKPRKGDILFGRVGTMGKPQIIDVDEPFCIFVSLGFFRDHTNIVIKEYISLWMQSFLFDKQVDQNVKGSAQRNLNTGWLKDFYIPFPPIEEQHRIVAKIEELLPFVDRYAASYEKLEQFNAKFPEDMKKSILQYAIQGKLVEQRSEEGTAEELYQQIQDEKQKLIKEGKIKKEKLHVEIAEDEIPFDIPKSWKWVKLQEIAISSLGKTLNKGTDEGLEVPYLCSINVYWDGIKLDQVKTAKFSDKDIEKYFLQKGDLLVCEGGDVGRSAVWDRDEEMYYQNALHCIRFYGNINSVYIKYCFEFYKSNRILDEASKGMTIKHLVQGSLYSLVFPLPPIQEQNRIVEKIEKLLPYCAQLTK